jgi:hypothetical protein
MILTRGVQASAPDVKPRRLTACKDAGNIQTRRYPESVQF